ncbi:MAG: insulinase family protein [Colwellia sp.]|nr:insulinase family protein [Colwellia sp.]
MQQSPNDLKIYQAVTLDNGLRVLLIENNGTNKSAAALAVNVGHFNDPSERQGLAHFLEHMLFLGTTKYPDGSEYQKFISQHGGSNNAWTATEHTCFFFDIQQQHFSSALKRFSQFFISPLLSEEFVNNERKNIDAEFKLKLKDDIRRLYDVHKETINPAHPFSQFSVGNIDTLADRDNSKVRDELKQFYDEFYRADYMTLVLEGPQSIEELQKLANTLFGDIPAADKAINKISAPLYLPEHQGVYLNIEPVKNDHQLIISFSMPSIDEFYRHKPETVLAYLLGHEGKGSILSLLKQHQWAMGLTAGSGINGSNFKDFNISISLTEQGEKHIDEIITIVFNYLALLKNSPIPEFYYAEKQAIAELSFTYHEKMKPLDSVSQLVINMQHYPVEDYIFGDYMMQGMCHQTIELLLNYLSAENMRIVHISKNINNAENSSINSDESKTFDQTSFWYQVPYRIEKICQEKLALWQQPKLNSSLFLPPKNPYILGKPEVYKDNGTTTNPKVIEQLDGLTIWYKQDTIFKVPKGYIYISIDAPNSIKSTENIAMTRLLVDLYSDTLIEENYDAELAGIHYQLYAHQGGVTLQLSGISEKQGELLTKLIDSLKGHTLDKDHFELLKQQLLNHWKNADTSKSISQLFSTLSSMMQPLNPSSEALYQALKAVDFDHFVGFSSTLFSQISIEVLIHGNWLKCHVNQISETIKNTFDGLYSEKNKVKYPILDIKSQGELLIPITLPEHDHASVIYYPQADKEISTIAKVMITSHLLSPFFFQEMRTEKQYGYLVGVGYIPLNRYPGIAFYIQSPHTSPEELIKAIDEFIVTSVDKIKQMSQQEWQHLQHGLSGQLLEKDSSLRIKSQRLWAALCNNDTEFNHKEQLVNSILAIDEQEVIDFISQSLSKASNPDRLLFISETKQFKIQSTDKNRIIINNINDFTKNCQRKY